MCVCSSVSGGAAKGLAQVSCLYVTQGGSWEALSLSSWSCSTLYKQLTFTRRGAGAQEVSSLRWRPARLLIHTHTCALSQWIVNVLLKVEWVQGDDSNLLPGSNAWLSANMLFVPSEMSLLLHSSFFFPSSKCPLFQLIFILLLAQTLPSSLLLDPVSRRSMAPLYLRSVESVKGQKVCFLLNWAGEAYVAPISMPPLRVFGADSHSPSLLSLSTSQKPVLEIRRSCRVPSSLDRTLFNHHLLPLSGWLHSWR